ncbi:MAG: FAD-dependent oxidoreductase, partial [Cyanobium sp.]
MGFKAAGAAHAREPGQRVARQLSGSLLLQPLGHGGAVDSSPPGGPGVLAGFIAGERAVRWQRLPERERRQAVLADLEAWWGPAAAEPLELVLHNWNAEPWSGGAFTSFLTPGAWTCYGRIWQQAELLQQGQQVV